MTFDYPDGVQIRPISAVRSGVHPARVTVRFVASGIESSQLLALSGRARVAFESGGRNAAVEDSSGGGGDDTTDMSFEVICPDVEVVDAIYLHDRAEVGRETLAISAS